MEHHKAEKLKLRLKFSKPLDNNHLQSPQQNLVLHIRQEPQQQEKPFVQQEQEDLNLVDVDDHLEENEIQEAEKQHQQQEGGDKRKVCFYCGKVFKNGKALGGHLRIHGEHSPKTNLKIKGFESGSISDVSGGEDSCPCEICGKKFPSKMSLYGHMRSHSHRSYRGVDPSLPPHQRDSDKNSDDLSLRQLDCTAVDGLRGLMGWKSKGRRGQLGYLSVEPLEVSLPLLSYHHRAEEATGELMMLDGGEEQVQDEVRSKFISQEKDDVRSKGKRIEEFDDDELYYLHDYLGISYPNTNTNNKNTIYSYFGAWNNTSLKNIEKSIPIKKRKMIRDMPYLNIVDNRYNDDHHHHKSNSDLNVEDDRMLEKTWLCTTCGKSFDSHQGLGGHRSGHHRERVIQSKKLSLNPTQDQTQIQAQIKNGFELISLGFGSKSGASGMKHDKEMVGELVHKCKICNHGFPTSLALVGHESCQYVVPSMDSLAGQTSSQTGCQGMTYQLGPNVILQEDGDGDDNGVVEST